MAGGSLGLLAGGALTQAIDWHWIFFVNVPIGVLTALAVRALVETRPGIGLGQGIDVLGAIVVTSAMALGVYAIVEAPTYGWARAHARLRLGRRDRAWPASSRSRRAWRTRSCRCASCACARSPGSSVVRAMMGTGMYGSFFLGALYLERVQGYDSVATGEAFLPWTLVVAALSVGPTANLVRRFGAGRPLLAGLVIMAGGLLVLSTAGAGDPYFPTVFVAFLLMGLGAGTAFMPLLTIAMADVPARDAGVASALVNVSLYISGALGLAALGAIATDRTQTLTAQGARRRPRAGRRLPTGLRVASACVLATVAVALVVLRAGRRVPVAAA